MAEVLSLMVAMGLLLRIGWTDFFSLKIRNRELLMLLAVVIVYLALVQPPALLLRAVFAVFLFTTGFAFWFFGKIGAGDAKLFGVVGLLIPPEQMLPFAVIMLAISIAMYYLLFEGERISRFLPAVGIYFEKFSMLNRVPYGVAISLATFLILAGFLFDVV